MEVAILGVALCALSILLSASAFAFVRVTWKREQEYLQIIRDLQKRIHAKDLTGYKELVEMERRKAERPKEMRSMTDAEEARIALMRQGLIDEATAEMMARTAG